MEFALNLGVHGWESTRDLLITSPTPYYYITKPAKYSGPTATVNC